MDIVILVGPSAAGKTTLENHLVDNGFSKIITTTTRPQGPMENDGEDYHFVDEETYSKMLANDEFAEHDSNYGKSYGITKKEFQKSDKLTGVLNLSGALAVREIFPESTHLIFVQPPTLNVLRERLINRGRDSLEAIEKRLRNADHETNTWKPQCDDFVVADVVEVAQNDLLVAVKKLGINI